MTTNEDQYGLYINDRWQVNDKLTVNAGIRWEYYPLMQRDNRGFEQLDLNTFQVLLPANSGDAGYESQKNLFAPRLGAAYRLNDDTVFRAGYGRTFNPMPWSRPLRGFYPASIGYSGAGANGFVPYGTLAQGIPGAPNPDVASGSVPLPRGVDMRTPEVGNVQRGTIDSWNVFVERRLPGDLALSAGYVGTATNNGYADINLNYAESGGNAARQYAAQAGNASILLWGARTKARYHSLQMALNRPFKNGLLLKGAYTFSKALNEADADGWTGVTWNQPSQYDRNYALAGYDRPHMLQMGFVYELPWMRESTQRVGLHREELADQRHRVVSVGHAVHGGRRQRPAPAGRRSADGQRHGRDLGRLRRSRSERAVVRPDGVQPAGQRVGQLRPQRVPRTVELEPGLLAVPGHPVRSRRIELRAEATNVLNHTQWGNPVTGLTDPNFMRIRTLARNPRRVQLGVRFAF